MPAGRSSNARQPKDSGEKFAAECIGTFILVFASTDGLLCHDRKRDGIMNKKRIIFVCVENSNRSQMAEAFAHIHGGEDIDACSARRIASPPVGSIRRRSRL